MYNFEVAFLSAFIQVAVLFILIVAGYVSRKIGVLDLEITRGFSRFIVNVSLPALAIASLQIDFSRERFTDAVLMFCIMVGCYLLYAVFAWLVPKILRAERRDAAVYRYLMVFSNTGFMGYPVLEAFFGREAVFYGVIFNIPYPLLTFTVGIGFMIFASGQPGEKRKIPWKNPGVLASLIAFILFLMPFRLPVILGRPIEMLGGLTTPLSMLVIGSLLTHLRIAELWKGIAVHAGVCVRLALIPLAVLGVLKALGFSGYLLGVPVLLSAMPAAASMSILADQFGGNEELASRLVFLSTLFSVFTLPLFALLVR
ncbi:MAG: AEC family transporter [Spirochaetales bacterium]|nr:AEC family transporter [Spirochaetales bacterium]